MNCKIYLSEIEEATSDALLSRDVRAHLSACRKCLGVYEERVVIRGLVGKLEKIEAPPDFEFRLRARLAASKPAKRRAARRAWFVPSLASIALAACFALTIAGAVFLKRATTTQSTAQSTNAPAIASPAVTTNTTGDVPHAPVLLETKDAPTHVFKVGKAGVNNYDQRRTVGLLYTERKRPPVAHKLFDSESADLSLRGANVITREGVPVRFANANNTSPVSIQVPSSSVEPLQIIWRDEQGNARPVSMKSISFGAQNPSGSSRQFSIPARPVGEGVW